MSNERYARTREEEEEDDGKDEEKGEQKIINRKMFCMFLHTNANHSSENSQFNNVIDVQCIVQHHTAYANWHLVSSHC